MKLNTLMIFTTIVALIFGLVMLVIPTITLGLYGSTLDVVGEFLARYFGASLLGLGLIAWFTRNETSKGLRTGFFCAAVIGLIVALYDGIAGPHNALVWLNVVIYLILTVGFGYFTFVKGD